MQGEPQIDPLTLGVGNDEGDYCSQRRGDGPGAGSAGLLRRDVIAPRLYVFAAVFQQQPDRWSACTTWLFGTWSKAGFRDLCWDAGFSRPGRSASCRTLDRLVRGGSGGGAARGKGRS